MTDLRLFTYVGGDDIRVLTVDGEARFITLDVLAMLDLSRSSVALLDEDEKGVHTVDTPGGAQEMSVITEPGLYSLILRSRKPEARAIKRWITHDVLPQIRRTGTYSHTIEVPQTYADALRAAADEHEKRLAAEAHAARLEPSARAWDHLAEDAVGDYSVREAAQILSRDGGIATGQRRLFDSMVELGWLDRSKQPYQRHVDNGRLVRRLRHFTDPYTGDTRLGDPQVRITAKGVSDLHRALGGDGQIAIQPKLQLVAGDD